MQWIPTVFSVHFESGYVPKKFPAVTDFDGEHVMQLLYRPPGKYYDFQVDLFLAESEYLRTALGGECLSSFRRIKLSSR